MGNAMPVVPINPGFTNLPQFINSLFDADVRASSVITGAIAAGKLTAAFSDQLPVILPVWLAAWQQSLGLPYNQADFAHCPPSDAAALGFLANYIGSNALSLYVPALEPVSIAGGQPPVYALTGYQQRVFKPGGSWDLAVVTAFLELLYHGAHFVAVHAAYDLAYGQPVGALWSLFKSSSALKPYRRHDPGNSHYTSLTNVCGYYVPDITADTAPANCPLLAALLCCPTVAEVTCNPSMYNSFLQLEGWEAPYARHNADYQTYKQTLWNISTFGACAYSEKRGTALFLAPADWAPAPSLGTFMPPYYGAEPAQAWLNTSLVQLPAGYPVTIVRGSTVPLDKRTGRCSVAFPLIQPNPGGTLAWSVPNAPAGSNIAFDLVGGSTPVIRGIRSGAVTASVAAGSNYTIANVTGGNSLKAYFEVEVTYRPPGT
jgi:hypothetical protein